MKSTYIPDEKSALAVDVAIASNRPLLVEGPLGSGKSSLTQYIAEALGWSMYPCYMNAQSNLKDLLYSFDSAQKLTDAGHAQLSTTLKPISAYIDPGPLWWALDGKSADEHCKKYQLNTIGHSANWVPKAGGAVLAVEDIDSVGSEVVNELLSVLGSRGFYIAEGNLSISGRGSTLLTVLTSESRRNFDPGFRQRVVQLKLSQPSEKRLIKLILAHFPGLKPTTANEVVELVTRIRQEHQLPPMNTVIFLDIIQAMRKLDIDVSDSHYRSLLVSLGALD